MAPVYLGADLGSSGIRILAVDDEGTVRAAAERSFDHQSAAANEQSPALWHDTFTQACSEVYSTLTATYAADFPAAIAISGTSGTLVCVDAAGRPTRSAILYRDPRAAIEARELDNLARVEDPNGPAVTDSFASAKALWVTRHQPTVAESTSRFLSPADFLVGVLTGDFSTTDHTHALKMGYDVVANRWPSWLKAQSGIAERLPHVVAPGEVVGAVTAAFA